MTGVFVKTETILDKILAHKVEEIAENRQQVSLADMIHKAQHAAPPLDFVGALRRDTVALIAEVKHASPSKGILVDPYDPAALSAIYADNGAAAISVLTDHEFFKGSFSHLMWVRYTVKTPVLRKDFVIDPYQVYEARYGGADAVLLIVAALADAQLAELHQLALELGMAALVEVHHESELDRALKIGVRLIGVNNRDLKTFKVDLNTTARLARLVPADVTLVAESGLNSADDVRCMGGLGAHAVLVGESLVKADNIAVKVREFSSQPRGNRDDQNQNLRRNHL